MTKMKISWKFGIALISVFVVAIMFSACGSAGENAGGNAGWNKISVNKSKLPKNNEEFYKIGDEYGYRALFGYVSGLKGSNRDNTGCINATSTDLNYYTYTTPDWYRVEYDSFEAAKQDLENYKLEYEKNNVTSNDDVYWKDLTYEESGNLILWKTTYKIDKEKKYNEKHQLIKHNNTNLYACLVDNVIYTTIIQYEIGDNREEWAVDNSFKLIGAMGLPEW